MSGTVLSAQVPNEEDTEYATPYRIWRPLSWAVDGFDLDPASGAEPVPIADQRYTEADDGLSRPWFGDVFLNPPWTSEDSDGTPKRRWLRKARNEAQRDAVDTVIVLLPAATEAGWFREHMWGAPALCFVGPGRIPFIGEDRNPSFALAIAGFGDVPTALLDVLDGFGVVVTPGNVYDPLPQTTLHEVTDEH